MKRYLVLAISLIILVGCAKQNVSLKTERPADEITVGIISELSTTDVSRIADNTAVEVMNQVGEGLYTLDSKGEAQPAVAQEVATSSADGLTYRIQLRKNVKWSNGEPLSAADFEFSWKRLANPDFPVETSYFDGILNYEEIRAGKKTIDALGIKALSDNVLEVKLERPMTYFSELLTLPSFFPLNEKYVKKQGNRYGTSSDTTLYNGPYVLKAWNGLSSNWRYEKNNDYWDKTNVMMKTINVQVIKDSNTAINLFNTQQLDIIKINGEYVAQEQGNPAMYENQLLGTYHLMFNLENKLLANQKVRKAIDLTIDSQQIAEKILNDGSTKAPGFVPQGFINKETGKDFADVAGELKQVNKKKAKKLWAEAKSELGIDQAKLEVLGSDTDNVKKVSEYIQGTLSDHLEGLTVSISSVPFTNRLERSSQGDFDAVISGWTPVFADPIDFLNVFVGTNTNNYSRWNNERYNALVKEAQTVYSTDYQKRWETLLEVDQLLAEEVPTVPLYQMSEVFLINTQLTNVDMGVIGSPYFKDISFIK